MAQQLSTDTSISTPVLLELTCQDFRRNADGSWVTTRQIDIGLPGAEQRLIPEGRRFNRGEMFLLGLDLAAVLERQCSQQVRE